ncbi:hypothetical protein CC1G_12299 [Coprinopsis cinerea okayama7|uniref:ABM domain-containing protein n=1 Tax=Coprinopsis cinerea (strain Okayama-7 / 130 / ATCC MYA-4618 / FGSC 9003) TaxID=240176 RepID=A8NE28_COPC7|nr:hypothetical protein CC1G_12299 [Coprinopsis cinerea okayama7\|eukprot:XP_001832930.1 hypothetical protein CC1G_12299 [Coprinopsis cinerea okayama7\
MSITELAVLKLNQPILTNPFPRLFNLVISRQSAWSGFPLFYYSEPQIEDTVYLISGWKDASSHWEWIKSDGNQELLTLFKPYIVDMKLHHLNIPFISFLEDSKVVVWRQTAAATLKERPYLLDLPDSSTHLLWEGRGPTKKTIQWCTS